MLNNSKIKEQVRQNNHKYVNEIYADHEEVFKDKNATPYHFVTSSNYKLNSNDIIDIIYQVATYNGMENGRIVFMVNIYDSCNCKRVDHFASCYDCNIVRKDKSDRTFNENNEINTDASNIHFVTNNIYPTCLDILNSPNKISQNELNVLLENHAEYLEDSNKEIVDFTALDLSGLDLSNKNLTGIDFRNSILDRANLSYSKLDKSVFNDASLENANISYASLQNVFFNSSNVNNGNFEFADIADTEFFNTELRRANFNSANLEYSTFKLSDLYQSTFVNAIIKKTKFYSTNIDSVNFLNAKLSRINIPLESNGLTADFSDDHIEKMLISTIRTGLKSNNTSQEMKEKLNRLFKILDTDTGLRTLVIAIDSDDKRKFIDFTNKNGKLKVLDLDYGEYNTTVNSNGIVVENDEFLKNYIECIKEYIGKYDVILVDSDNIIRKELGDNNIKHIHIISDLYGVSMNFETFFPELTIRMPNSDYTLINAINNFLNSNEFCN